MNTLVQNILAFIAVALAIWFLLHKFGVLPKKKLQVLKLVVMTTVDVTNLFGL